MRMIIRRQCAVLSLTVLLVLVLTANLYFIYMIVEEKTPNLTHKPDLKVAPKQAQNKISDISVSKQQPKLRQSYHRNASELARKRILQQVKLLPTHLLEVNDAHRPLLEKVITELKPSVEFNPSAAWTQADQWVTGRWVVPDQTPLLGSVLRTLCAAKILRAQSARQHGTQLKLLLTLEGGHRAVFKPQWYTRDQVIEGPVYAGKDRHNAEVAAFHLGLLLGLRRSPLVVGRRVSLRREVMPVADRELLDTFYQEGNNTCLYGVCHYCGPHDPVCASRDLLEGALVLWLPPRVKLKKVRHPWQRTYREAMPARWEGETRYCERVRASKFYGAGSQAGTSRLLDLIDASILDFLIDNGDRHHYELLGNSSRAVVLLLDNGKSFGNPKVDHIDILAPLYQCCMLRRSTWERLLLFSGGTISHALEASLAGSHIAPVLTAAHLTAVDRRLKLVFSTVYVCAALAGSSDINSVLV